MKSKHIKLTLYLFKYLNNLHILRLQIHQWSNTTLRRIIRKNWGVRDGRVERIMDIIVTPKVVEEVRNHFNCSKLEGAELEDQGGEGTALTHWEKRIFEVCEIN